MAAPRQEPPPAASSASARAATPGSMSADGMPVTSEGRAGDSISTYDLFVTGQVCIDGIGASQPY